MLEAPPTVDLWVLITASRDWKPTIAVRNMFRTAIVGACERINPEHPRAVGLRHGKARGGDTIADHVAAQLRIHRHPMPADWSSCAPWCPPNHMRRRPGGPPYCPDAGHRRNDEMIRLEPVPREVLVFPMYPYPRGGTWRCAASALEAGLPVRVVSPTGAAVPLEALPA